MSDIHSLAAKSANLPSILITNFTFDSVYSYFSTTLLESDPDSPSSQSSNSPHLLAPTSTTAFEALIPDFPVPPHEIAPLVAELQEGYNCASLLVLLPGAIPIPSFPGFSSLPATDWVDSAKNVFHEEIARELERPLAVKVDSLGYLRSRMTVASSLLVRAPTAHPSPYTSMGRRALLSSIGIPDHLQDPERTKILAVSFGGQPFRAPSRSGSRTPCRSPTPNNLELSPKGLSESQDTVKVDGHLTENDIIAPESTSSGPSLPDINVDIPNPGSRLHSSTKPDASQSVFPNRRLVTPCRLWIPGAPPALHITPPSSPLLTKNTFNAIEVAIPEEAEGPTTLPDDSWIAIVCGVSKEQWVEQQEKSGEEGELPEGFYLAPMNIYMPDLTAVADALLGKLVSFFSVISTGRSSTLETDIIVFAVIQGYGTVAECVDSCTPFVYGK
jgi:hypothetical protein